MGYTWRIVLITAIVWLLYRLIKVWLTGKKQKSSPEPLEEMVQDPQCQIYLPRTQAVVVKKKGEDYYFCSNECRDQYFDKSGT